MTPIEQKLFRLTLKRKLILEDIITKINLKINLKSEDSFAGLAILHHPHLSEEEKKTKLAALKKEQEEYRLHHDVLEIVASHTNEINRSFFMKEERGWNSEWDVPLDVFNDSIEKIIELLKWYQDHVHPKYKNSYNEKIEFLLTLKNHRNS